MQRNDLEKEYDLSIDETDKLFCVKYHHDSRLWTSCLPFYKFWNYSEPQTPTKSRNWNHFTEKLDGSFF